MDLWKIANGQWAGSVDVGVKRKVREELARFDDITRRLEALGMSSASAAQAPLSPRPAKRGEGGETRSVEGGEGKGPRVRMC